MNNFEIIDEEGVIRCGSRGDMEYTFAVMTRPDGFSQTDQVDYLCEWNGDLKLVEVHNVFR